MRAEFQGAMLDRYPHMLDQAAVRPPVAQNDTQTRSTPMDTDTGHLDTSRLSGIFAKGTLINTPNGRVQIEHLSAGDVVLSFRNGKLAVQNCYALPDQSIPDFVLCVRAGYLDATDDLITLPNQRVRLNHWLAAALFETRFPFVTASHVCLDHGIELVPKAHVQFYRLGLGVCEAITANGVMCITDPSQVRTEDDRRSPIKNYEHRDLTPDETALALEVGSFFKRSRKKT